MAGILSELSAGEQPEAEAEHLAAAELGVAVAVADRVLTEAGALRVHDQSPLVALPVLLTRGGRVEGNQPELLRELEHPAVAAQLVAGGAERGEVLVLGSCRQ